jgi:HlyD family secretion protein
LYETGRVAGGILRHGLILVSSMVTVLCIMASLVLLDPFVALASIVGLASSYAGVYAIARSKLRRNGEIESEDFAERTRIVSEGFGAVKELIVLQAQPLFVARLARCCRSISRTIVNNLAIAQSPKYLLEGVIACLLVGVALYSHAGGTSAASLIAHLSFVGLAVYRLLPALQQVFFAGVKIRADAPAFERIAADLQLALARKPAAASGGGDPLWLGRPHHAIHLRGVSFSHGHRGGPAIADLTLSIPSGTMIGFIGANGSGKTTLIDVVCGLLVPQSGRVDIDGVALDDANRRAWQSVIAYVPQQVFVCDASLAENVALGVKSPHIDQVRLRSAVRLARLEDCVAGLPDGYGGKLGGTGARLSGGQRQRLGIARALYRDASVIIMDEATSSLDLAAEREITDMLAELRPGRTMLLVAHRLNALRHCDVIHELENGRISSSGTFQHFRARAAGEYGLSEEAPQGAMQAPVIGQRQSVERLDEARCLAADRG